MRKSGSSASDFETLSAIFNRFVGAEVAQGRLDGPGRKRFLEIDAGKGGKLLKELDATARAHDLELRVWALGGADDVRDCRPNVVNAYIGRDEDDGAWRIARIVLPHLVMKPGKKGGLECRTLRP